MKIGIIGAGAAGLMCASLLNKKHEVVLFDKNSTAGKKLLLTGGGRCNLTNLVEVDEFLESVKQNSEFFLSALQEFVPKDAVDFFNKIGIETQVENNSRVFPKIGRATDVRDALQKAALEKGAEFRFESSIINIEKIDKNFALTVLCLKTHKKSIHQFDVVIMATGGMSYPITGSTGDGYIFASKFGHRVIPTRPALCGLQLQNRTRVHGSTITCGIAVVDGNFNHITKKETGEMMFTKNGISGPVIFRTTSNFKQKNISSYFLQIDFVPHYTKNEIEEKLSTLIKENPKDKIFYVFRKFVPQAVANWLVEISGISKTKSCANFTFAEKQKFFSTIKDAHVKIKDFDSIETATITRGGIDVVDINSSNMQSKLIKNLFFIGEILDIDALSGGFNLQIAFSTAATCANWLSQL